MTIQLPYNDGQLALPVVSVEDVKLRVNGKGEYDHECFRNNEASLLGT